jgi:hypothetical protein
LPHFGEPPACSGPDVKVFVLGSILIVAVEMEQEYTLHGGRPPYLNKPRLRGLCGTHDYLLLYLLEILAIIFRVLSYSTVKNAKLFLRIKVGEIFEDIMKP